MATDIFSARPLDEQPDFPDRTAPIGFMLRLAKSLHTYGMTAYELEGTMHRVGESLGFSIQCLSQPTSITMSFSDHEDSEPRLYVFKVDPGEVQLEKQLQVAEVVRAVSEKNMSVVEGAKQLKAITTAAARYGSVPSIISFGLLSGAIARVLGGGVSEIVVALLIGLATGGMAFGLKNESAQHLFPTIAAVIAALVSSFFAYIGWIASPYIATLSGVIVLVPGLLLTTAIAELSTRHMVSGTARLFSAGTIFMQIGFGVAIGNGLGNSLFPTEVLSVNSPLPDWSEWLSIVIASLGLFVLFQARPKDLLAVILAGLIAYSSTLWGTHQFGSIMGALVGAFSMGLASNIFERLTHISRSVMLMPGIILLVPGSVGFQSLSLLVEHDIIAGLDTAFKMSFVGFALVTGLLFSNLLLPPKQL